MSEPRLGSVTIPHLIAKQVNPQKHGLSETDLATAIQEVEVQTQISGASFLTVHVTDPEWVIQTSGLIAVNEDGLLNELQVEFPEGSGSLWQLARVDGSTDLTANLALVFEDIIVARLRQRWKHRTIPPGLTTRAQFVKALVHEANLAEHLNPPIKFVSPGINRKEPVAESTEEKQEKLTQTPAASQSQEAKANKERGVHPAAEIKIKGVAATSQQLADINTALEQANADNAGTVATLALFCAGIGESDFNRSSSNASGHNGIWQSYLIPGNEVAKQAHYFLIGGESFQAGGAIQLAKEGHEPGDIATKVEASGEPADFYGKYLPEAEAIVHAGGGIKAGGTASSSNESDVGQLSRGTPQNPDEDSWECISRLASEVAWSAFTDGKNTLFYMDGPDLMAQKPVLYIDVPNNVVVKEDSQGRKVEVPGALVRPLSYSYDNTAFLYRATHKVKGKLQRKSKIAKPQTPSEVRMLMLCDIDEYRAGEVFVFRNSGPISENGGRWIVADATRQTMKYPYTQFLLVPPTEPLPEPKASGTGLERENPSSAAGQAQKALTEKSKYRYVYGGGHQEGSKLFGPEPREFDCSSFVAACYQEAGIKIPGQSGGTLPGTQEMIEAMKKVTTPQPGAMGFFGTLTHTTHVNVVVGSGRSISMGKEGDPSEGPSAEMGPSGFLGYWEPK